MNKEEIINEVIQLLSTSDYIDPSENLHDGLKLIKGEITYATVHDFLWSMSANVIDVDGKVNECINKIRPLMNHLSKEKYNQIVDEAYENYSKEYEKDNSIGFRFRHKDENGNPCYGKGSKEMFINKIKTDQEFSEKCGLKIEERELSLEERHNLALPIWKEKYGLLSDMMIPTNVDNTPYKIPTKLITITYSNQTIEYYE